MAVNPIVAQLQGMKDALQELEAAVQEPRDQVSSIDHVNERFRPVFDIILNTLRQLLQRYESEPDTPAGVIEEAHKRGWLRGDLHMWQHMVQDYERLMDVPHHSDAARAVCQDVRACTCLLWETYELLMAKFRWQTQIVKTPVP